MYTVTSFFSLLFIAKNILFFTINLLKDYHLLDKSTKKQCIVKYNYNPGDYNVNTNPENITGDVEGKNELILSLEHKNRENEKTVEDAQKSKAPIYFHAVIGIYHDEYGNIFYLSKYILNLIGK